VSPLPQLGFYCLYKRRQPGTLNYNPANEGRYQSYKNQPDCANITGILTQHALWLTADGIDYVVVRNHRGVAAVTSSAALLLPCPQCALFADAQETSACWVQVDATNLPDYNPTSDAVQLRPFEVLCEVRADVKSTYAPSMSAAGWGCTLASHGICGHLDLDDEI
jgi:hypothetical protein